MANDIPPDAASTPQAGRRAVFSWILFDWAAQPFFTLITTFVFAPFFAGRIAASPAEGQALWGYAVAAAGLVIALLSPVLGAVADAGGRRKTWIAGFSVMLIVGSASLWIGKPGDAQTIPLVIAGFMLASIGVEFATVFTNAMMPDLVPRHRLGRLSGHGWAAGYAGGLLSLVLVLGFLAASPTSGRTLLGFEPVFGLDPALGEGERASGPFTAIWYLVFVLPLFLFVHEAPAKLRAGTAIGQGLRTLATTLRNLRSHRQAFLFLFANMAYKDALTALFAFGGIYAVGILGWSTVQIGIFGILLTITGTIGALIGGKLDDHVGPKAVITGALTILIVCCIGIVSIDRDSIFFVIDVSPVGNGGLFSSLPEVVYLILGGFIGAAAGPLQSASRTLMIHLSPPGRTTEFFGLFAMSGKATSFIGPLAVAALTAATQSQRIGISVIVVLFALGMVLLLRVRQ